MKMLTEIEEAAALKLRFAKLKSEQGISRASFARDNKFPGGDALIYQHIDGRRRISMEAALIYAKGFGCTLEEISPRLAAEARRSAKMLDPENPESNAPLDVLTVRVFPLRCPECGKVSHKSFIELEMNDRLPCDHCKLVFNINDQYGHRELEAFLQSIGRKGFILRQNREFD